MGIGALCVVMLGFPLVSVLLATLLLVSDGLKVIPLVIVAVVVAYVGRAVLSHLVLEERHRPLRAATDLTRRRGPAPTRPRRGPPCTVGRSTLAG